jgi:dTDP-4-amino-4,6-dideoxygalactose transaminase/nucleoside-diphosphate-sugar epimerase
MSAFVGSSRRRILVTGGAGFIGTHAAKLLAGRGHSVLCLDRSPPEPDRSLMGSGIDFLKADVLDEATIDRTVAEADSVLHLASVVGVDEYLRDPTDVLDTGILGSRNVLRAALRYGRPVLMASTSEIYGKTSTVLHEDSDSLLGPPHKPRWSYSIAKSAAEHYGFALASQGLCFAVVRYFNVYGPLLDAPGRGRVVAKFLGCLQEGRPLSLVDGGAAVRSLCYVDDAVEATVDLALALAPGEPVAGRAFNVGRAEPVSMRQLAELMIELSGRDVGVRHVRGREFFGEGFEEIPYRVPDVSALHEAIGFTAHTDLREGMRRTLAHWGLLATSFASDERSPAPAPIPTIRPFVGNPPAVLGRIAQSLESGRLSNGGPNLAAFEAALAVRLGVDEVACVSSGADALLLSMRALGVRGKVVLPAFTYIASLAAVTGNALEPVFCDIDPKTWTLCPAALARVLEQQPDVSVVLPVNVYGVPPDLSAILELCRASGAAIVYDDAHGFGTERAGARFSPEPSVTAFSFHATKLVPAAEGGAVVTRDPKLLAEIQRLRNHGLAPDLASSSPGFNAKLDELRAAVGLSSLEGLDAVLARRRSYAERLRAHVRSCTDRLRLQEVPSAVVANNQNLAVVCQSHAAAERLIEQLAARGVEGRRYFHPALHRLRDYRGRFVLPETDRVADGVVCLPLHDHMTEVELERIEQALTMAAQALE